MIKSKIKIATKTSNYQILIGNNLIKNLKTILKINSISSSKFLIVYDKNIPRKTISILKKKLKNNKIFLKFFSNEKNKNQKSVDKILNILLKNGFTRNDCIISIGGGIVGDVTGFAASIFKRGLKFVNIPSSLLAQVDSSIGGKTGINSKYGKNLIGSFYQPNLVVTDIDFLKSLPKREIVCGYAEIFKHSIISKKKFFNFLIKNFDKIINLKTPFINKAIYESCIIKKKIVEKDEKEKNLRKVLNLGHTFAHSYEATMGYSNKLNHGEAVLLGIDSAAEFSHSKNILGHRDYILIKNHILKINSKLRLKNFFKKKDTNKLIRFMVSDKKNVNNKINLILINKIGKVLFKKFFSQNEIAFFIKKQF